MLKIKKTFLNQFNSFIDWMRIIPLHFMHIFSPKFRIVYYLLNVTKCKKIHFKLIRIYLSILIIVLWLKHPLRIVKTCWIHKRPFINNFIDVCFSIWPCRKANFFFNNLIDLTANGRVSKNIAFTHWLFILLNPYYRNFSLSFCIFRRNKLARLPTCWLSLKH